MEERIRSLKITRMAVLLAGLFFIYYASLILASSKLIPEHLIAHFGIEKTRSLQSIHFAIILFGGIFSGILSDWFGVKRFLIFSIAIQLIGQTLLFFPHHFELMLLSRCLTTLGIVSTFIGAIKLFASRYAERKLGLLIAGLLFLTQFSVFNASFWTQTFETLSRIHYFSLTLAILGTLLFAVAIWDYSAEEDEGLPLSSILKSLFNRNLWVITFVFASLQIFASLFYGHWGFYYTAITSGFTTSSLRTVFSMLFWVGMIALFLFALSRYSHQKRTLQISLVLSGAIVLMLLHLDWTPNRFLILLTFLAFFTGAKVLCYTLLRQVNFLTLGAGIGFMQTMAMLIGLLITQLIQHYISLHHYPTQLHNFTRAEYQLILSTIPFAFFLSALALKFFDSAEDF